MLFFRIASACCLAVSVGAAADPLPAFEAKVRECRLAYEVQPKTEVVFATLANSWVKRVYGLPEVSYDVVKTESLVTPFTAYIKVVQSVAAERAADEAAASALALPPDGAVTLVELRAEFSWQNSRWALRGGAMTNRYKRQGESVFGPARPVQMSIEQLESRGGPFAKCR